MGLHWRPLPRSPPARPFLLSGPGAARRPGASRRAPQAASSRCGGDAGAAVTMETAGAARAWEAGSAQRPEGGGRLPRTRRPPSPTYGVDALPPQEAATELGKEGDKNRGRARRAAGRTAAAAG